MLDLKQNRKNKFKVDFDRLLELSKTDEFAEFVSEFLLKEFEDKNNLNFDFFVIYWNRNSGKLFIKKVKNGLNLETYPFDNDLISHFSLFSSSTQKFLKVFTYKNNSSEIDFETLKTYVQKELSKNLSELLSLTLIARMEGNFVNLREKQIKGEIIPIDCLDEKSQFEYYWSSFIMFNIEDGNKDFFNEKKIYLNNQICCGKGRGPAVSGFLTNKKGKLFKPFEPYKQQLLDYGLEIILDFSQPPKNKNILLRFLKENIEDEEVYQNLLKKLKDGILKKIKNSCKKLSDYVENKLSDPFLNKNNFFNFYEFDNDLLGVSFIEDSERLILKEIQDLVEIKPFTYCSFLPNKIYKLLKRNLNLIESFNTIEEVREAGTISGSKIYCPYYHNLVFNSGNDNAFIQRINQNPFDRLEKSLIENNFKTTVKIKEEIKLILNFSTINFTKNERSHLNFVLQMKTVDL
jgi:hypothetical protein